MMIQELITIILSILFIIGFYKLIKFICNNIPASEPRPATQGDIIIAVIILLIALGRF